VEFLFKKHKITWLKGTGRLAGGRSVAVKNAEGKEEKHDAKKAVVISTGSRVRGLPQIGLELNGTTVLSSDDVLVLEKAPKTLAVIGAGAVGCEFADVFSSFGTQVTLLEVLPALLPLEDAEVSAELGRSFRKRKIDVITGARVSGATVKKDAVTLSVESGGAKKDLTVEKVLVAAGRAPNVEELGLKEAGVQLTERGFIRINERMETSAPGIFAIGDVAGPPMLAHKGSREGIVLAELLAGQQHVHLVNYDNVPNATYCHPEVASVGATEQRLKEKNTPYKVGKFPFSANGRARTAGDTAGFVKFIADATTDELLGAHMIGPNVSELIAEVVLAFEYRGSAEDIGITVHAHPTLSEVTKEAALATLGRAIHI